MIKQILTALLLVATTASQAGLVSFTAGAITGAALGSSGSAKSSAPGTLIASDKYNILVCEAYNPQQCESMPIPRKSVPLDVCLRYDTSTGCTRTPGIMHEKFFLEDFIKLSGFTTIVGRSVLIQDGKQYHVLEVK
jgi:hypothetical protein